MEESASAGIWKKSGYSGNDDNCVEVLRDGPRIRVRDSKRQSGPVLGFTPSGWGAFVAALEIDGRPRGSVRHRP